MSAQPKDRFAEIKRCLTLADRAFAEANRCEDQAERNRLVDEAESWLVAAERAFARLTDRMGVGPARQAAMQEARSFRDHGASLENLVWRSEHRKPHA